MGFQNWTVKYKKLDEAAVGKATEATRRRRWRWMKLNGRVMIRGVRLWRCRKVKIECKGFSMANAIGKIYGEVVKRVNAMESSVCPQFLLCCHWGLPVLSHSTLKFSISKPGKNSHAPLRPL